MKTKPALIRLIVPLLITAFNQPAVAQSDPQLSSWFTAYSGQYARLYTTDANRSNNVSVTTWSNGQESQTLPAYCGVQEIDYSTSWIYFRTTDLGGYTMGPWYNDATRTTAFVNLPENQKIFYRIPRTASLSAPPATKTVTMGAEDAVGYFVEGVAMFDPTDAWSYSNGTEASPGTGQWHRDAYVNEKITFDAGNTHQQNTGKYHNHADPIALRQVLGDNIAINPTNNTYYENVANTNLAHSPIIGWVRDGLPMYGPYGYSNPTNPASGIRRMISGFVLRNGQNGTDNLTNTARASLPAWALRNNGNTTAAGPAVSTTYPLGRYCEDNSYLGDLTNSATGSNYVLGVDFDLNEYNVRWCYTPEFPTGTYAYFVCITSNGTPTFPYNLNRYFYGNPTGGTVSSLTETVTTNFLGGTNASCKLNSPAVNDGTVTLTWSAVEGGTYQVQSTTNFSTWNTLATNISPNKISGSYTNTGSPAYNFYRVARTAVANFDPVTGTSTGGGSATIVMSPNSHAANNVSFPVTATISSSATPPVPPQSGAPVASFTVGTLSVTNATYTYSGGSGIVSGTLTIPNGTSPGSPTVTITFTPPMNQTQGPSYTQTNAFTIN